MTGKLILNDYYQNLKTSGMCTGHPGVSAVPGKSICQACVDYNKLRVSEAKTNGMCVNHIKVPAVAGAAVCQACIDYKKSHYEKSQETGVCTGHPGIPVVPGKKVCQQCLDRKKAHKQASLASGMCPNHPKVSAAPGRTRCQACIDRVKLYERERRKTDMVYKIQRNLRARFSRIFRDISSGGPVRSASAVRHLGCTIPEFMAWIESKFIEGMSWANHGKWHFDHFIPLCSFDLANPDEQIKAMHYTNLQPLWAKDNLKKGGSIPLTPATGNGSIKQ